MGSHFCEYIHCCSRFKAAGDQFISATVPRKKSSANRVEMKAWLRLCASKTKDLICVILQKQQDMTCMFLFKQRRTANLEIPVQTQMCWVFFPCSLHMNDWLWGCFHVVFTDFIKAPWSWCSRFSGSYFAAPLGTIKQILHWWPATITNHQLMLDNTNWTNFGGMKMFISLQNLDQRRGAFAD